MSKKKKPLEESRFAKKAIALAEKINTHYSKEKPEPHPYSFIANKYRISLFFGIILIIYSLLNITYKNTTVVNCKSDSSMLKDISSTVQNSKKSLSVIYDLYKNGGLNVASEFAKIKNANQNQKIHIDFSSIVKDNLEKNVLVCGEKFSAKLGIANPNEEKQTNIEYKTMDLVVGENVNNNKNLANIFLQLSENDKITAVFETDKREDVTVVYISDIKPENIHMLGFYDVNNIFDGTSDPIKCGDSISLVYDMYNISENKIIHQKKSIKSELKDAPILLERILVGKSAGSRIKVTTKLRNLCVFKEGISYGTCHQFWQPGENNLEDVVVLTIELHDSKNK